MKILLIGEYSRLHNSLKEGLIALGHEVTIAGSGDYFKKYPVDIHFEIKYTKGIMLFVKKVLFRLFKIDITSLHIKKQFNSHKEKFKNYDVVQLINEKAFGTYAKTEIQLLKFVFEHNKNVFLLSCGADYINVKFANENKLRYSILTPYEANKEKSNEFLHILDYLSNPYKELHDFVYKNIKGVIASDIDYHLPLQENKLYLGLIPNPINTEKLKYIDPKTEGKIIIFHGINEHNYYKKGNDIFEAALNIIQEKYSEKIEVITTRSLPYDTYINMFNSAHIILDQVYSYDQGFNALEAMAKGKVVFTGAEQEWLDFYGLQKDTVCINALPDAKYIADKLEWLINNPEKITEISKHARAFVEKEHLYTTIAEKYIKTWSST